MIPGYPPGYNPSLGYQQSPQQRPNFYPQQQQGFANGMMSQPVMTGSQGYPQQYAQQQQAPYPGGTMMMGNNSNMNGMMGNPMGMRPSGPGGSPYTQGYSPQQQPYR